MNYRPAFGSVTQASDLAGASDANANGIERAGALTGHSPTLSAVGDDTNIGITLVPKGTGTVNTGGEQGAATSFQEYVKRVTAFSDTVAKAVIAVTVPNGVVSACFQVTVLSALGAGGAIGAGEGTRISTYQVVLARMAGVNVVATVSSAVGGAEAHVAGAASVTSAVITASSITGAVGATNTFNILLAITKSGGSSDNHTATITAKVINANASGVTFA